MASRRNDREREEKKAKASRGSKYIKSQIIVNLSKTFYCALLFKLAVGVCEYVCG